MNIDYWQEVKRVQENRESARVHGLPATLTLDEWFSIIEQFQGMCAYCLNAPFEELEHLIPLAAGLIGTVDINCIPSCKRCNRRKCGYYEDIHLSPTERLERIRYMLQHNRPIRRSVSPSMGIKVPATRKVMVLTPEDLELIAELKRYHGIASDNEVIRMALRAAHREIASPIAPHKERRSYPPHE